MRQQLYQEEAIHGLQDRYDGPDRVLPPVTHKVQISAAHITGKRLELHVAWTWVVTLEAENVQRW
jgi:hypothetical protein